MKNDKLTIGILGAFQNGKSTLVNCLIGREVARTGGYGKSVTSVNTRYSYGDSEMVRYYQNGNLLKEESFKIEYEKDLPNNATEIHVILQSPILKHINILDTPGFNANEHDDSIALSSYDDIDAAVLLIINKGLNIVEKNIAKQLTQKCIPYFIIMNCMDEGNDMWKPDSEQNVLIANNIIADLELNHLNPIPFGGKSIWVTNLLWFWHSLSCLKHTELESKQSKRIRAFFDLFFDEHLSKSSHFKEIDKCLQDKQALTSLHTIVALQKEFEFYSSQLASAFKNIIDSNQTFIQNKIIEYRKAIDSNKEKIDSNKDTIEQLKGEIEDIDRESSFDFSSGGFFANLLWGAGKYLGKQLRMSTKGGKIRALEQENGLMTMDNNSYADFIKFLNNL